MIAGDCWGESSGQERAEGRRVQGFRGLRGRWEWVGEEMKGGKGEEGRRKKTEEGRGRGRRKKEEEGEGEEERANEEKS